MKSKTFRLEESDIELLKQLASDRGESQSDALRYAIQNAAGALHGAIHDEEASDEPSEVVSELIRQLKVKDEQIAALNQALVNAQVLHAKSTQGELPETTGDQPRKSWFQRWFS